MIKIATIGTSEICSQFARAAKKNISLKITCVYSRVLEKAKTFIKDNDIKTAKAVDKFETIVDEVDAVYIASPNGLHYEQAKYFLLQQKHVLIEKPITLDAHQALELGQIATMNNVFVMEAFKTIHLPQFKHLVDWVEENNPFLANLSFNQYSSRMSSVKGGIFESVFDAKLGKGSTYDTLIYPVELAISLFGPVKEVKAMAHLLPNGVALNNVVILKHENDTLVSITNSKSSHGQIGSELLSDSSTLVFQNLTRLTEIAITNHNDLKNPEMKNFLNQDAFDFEIQTFIEMINNQEYNLRDYLLEISIEAIRVLNLIESNHEKIGEN
ncbi:oxioreductase [Spiroplasma sabaudiense Ar-1343]|uniref:Oxioreductase n=1 Tax=Spiroplasma sabaudiense Ar-1343 TaxID=1276257 RepID=W6AA43_9MOLU|nr:Gfo/Idh/MocA family oxidoreductase [Spiroplasma sabaudiense]AHI53932.1 oxioreductase [Spiroplasma sabaudiense Ar-1343]